MSKKKQEDATEDVAEATEKSPEELEAEAVAAREHSEGK